jgi:hypothetical protein
MWWARLLNNVIGVLAPTTPLVTSSYESIATTVVGSGGSSSITFNSIPSTYKHLQVRLLTRLSTGDVNVTIKLNSDAGNNYTGHFLYGTGSSAAAGALSPSSGAPFITRTANSGNSSGIFAGGVIDLLDYKETTKYKTVRALSGYDGNGSGEIFFNSALWMNTAAITQIEIIPSAGNFVQYSSFALYGIKG